MGRGGIYYPGRNKERKKIKKKAGVRTKDRRARSALQPAGGDAQLASGSTTLGLPYKPCLHPAWDGSDGHFEDAVPGISLGFAAVPPTACRSQLPCGVLFRGEVGPGLDPDEASSSPGILMRTCKKGRLPENLRHKVRSLPHHRAPGKG